MKPLTHAMRAWLKHVVHHGHTFQSPTHRQLVALERRGLVTFAVVPQRLLTVKWTPTEEAQKWTG